MTPKIPTPAQPTLAELAAHAATIATLRHSSWERASEGLWIVALNGTAVLNRVARRIAGDFLNEVDFGEISWDVWHADGRPWPANEWPVTRALYDGEITRDARMVVRGPLREPYALRIIECWPVREAGLVIGCTVRLVEIDLPDIDDPPWNRDRESECGS